MAIVVHGRREDGREEVYLVHVRAHSVAHEEGVEGLRYVRCVDAVVIGHIAVTGLDPRHGLCEVVWLHSEVIEEVVPLEDSEHEWGKGHALRRLEELEAAEVPLMHVFHDLVQLPLLRGRDIDEAIVRRADVLGRGARGDAVSLLGRVQHRPARGLLLLDGVLRVEPLGRLGVEVPTSDRARVEDGRVKAVRPNHVNDPVQVALVRRTLRAHSHVLEQSDDLVHGRLDAALELLVLHLLEALARLVQLVKNEEHADDSAKPQHTHDGARLIVRRDRDHCEHE
mmetsp:Transcript_12427/g.33240  ORF Transcript_12427/g.33240 Transcript_12427/m.33240 type:complete len:282 (+) Transcript_12427:1056-1901(+)